MGFPVNVPLRVPPLEIVTVPLKVDVPLNVLFPLNVVLPAANIPTEKLSTVHCRFEGDPHVPPPASTTLYAAACHQMLARPAESRTTGFEFCTSPVLSVYVAKGVLVPAWYVQTMPLASCKPAMSRNWV